MTILGLESMIKYDSNPWLSDILKNYIFYDEYTDTSWLSLGFDLKISADI